MQQHITIPEYFDYVFKMWSILPEHISQMYTICKHGVADSMMESFISKWLCVNTCKAEWSNWHFPGAHLVTWINISSLDK